jgi:signal transduction histidine kinase/putative methionine-R-sulfoxide reductase with GAF domain
VKRETDSLDDDRIIKVRTGDRVSELEEQLVSTRRVLEAFRDIASALAAPVDPDSLLGLVLERASALLDADRATLYLIDDATGELVSKLVVGGGEQTIRLAVGQGIAGTVVQAGKAIRVPDAYEDNRFSRGWDGKTGYRTRSILAVPMKNHVGQTIGVLQVLNKRNGKTFTDEDESLLGALATQAAISIDNVKLYLAVVEKNNVLAQVRRKLERKVDFLNLLFELESAMARAVDQRQLVQSLLGLTVAATRTKAGSALLLDPDGLHHPVFVYRQDVPGVLAEHAIDRPIGTFLQTIRQAGPVCMHDVRRRTKATAELSLIGVRARSILAVPMLSEQGEAFGALVLYDREDGSSFTDDDRELLRLVAANASTAISLLRSRESQRVSDRLSTIGRLLSSVLHDLKTPMAVISGYVQLMASTENAEQRRSYSELVLKQFDHITAMQREVLAFARGERTLLVSKVYLQKFFDELRVQLERELEGRGVKLELELRDRGTARFDQAKVTRALHNLARNALDAMGTGGTLRIVVDRDAESLVVRVSDTGPGIPEQIRGKLFESFVTAEKTEGTGLGLAIVKKIVEEHGGRVDVSSSSQGAEFTLRLPQV